MTEHVFNTINIYSKNYKFIEEIVDEFFCCCLSCLSRFKKIEICFECNLLKLTKIDKIISENILFFVSKKRIINPPITCNEVIIKNILE